MDAATVSAWASVGTLVVAVAGFAIVLLKVPSELRQTWYRDSDTINDFLWENLDVYQGLFPSRIGDSPSVAPVAPAKIQLACEIILDALERIALSAASGESEGATAWKCYIKKFYNESPVIKEYYDKNWENYTNSLRTAFGLTPIDRGPRQIVQA